jgi:GNAT superfamily N-acetyltransferase
LNALDANDLEIVAEDITSPVAAAFIGALNAELAAGYSEAGANHFRLDPNEVAPGVGCFLVVRRRGVPIGCGALRALHDDESLQQLGPGVGELKRMYVAPDARGEGIGRALVARLEDEARRLGLTRLVLETGTRQAAALALYRGLGFVDIPPYNEYVLSPATSVCLAKDL